MPTEPIGIQNFETNKFIEKVISHSKLIETRATQANDLLKKIVLDADSAKRLNTTLNRIIKTSNASIVKFRKERDQISSLLSQANKFYDQKYLPLQKQIEDKNSGFQASIKISNDSKNEILKLKELSSSQYEEIKNFAREFRRTNRELTAIDKSIRNLSADATAKHLNIDQLQKAAKGLEGQISNFHNNISKLFTSSEKKEAEIARLLIESTSEYNAIETLKRDSSSLLTEIQTIYEIAAETGLSGEFDKRGNALKGTLSKWEKRIFWTSTLLFLMVVIMFVGQLALYQWDLANHTFDINFYIRFLICSPVIYYLYFCSSEYSQTKMLHDKYSFKTTLAMSIKQHIQLLTEHEKFDEKERIDKILEFALDGFRKIYTEPHTKDDYRLKLKLANMELNIEKKLLEAISKTIGVTTEKILPVATKP